MSFEVSFMPRAERQIGCLQSYLADRFYPINALRFIERLTAQCHSLREAPHRGTLRPDLGHDVRMMGFERTVSIFFRVNGQRVLILSISYRGQIPGKFR
jgi:plasmid stabilization system protein ParE